MATQSYTNRTTDLSPNKHKQHFTEETMVKQILLLCFKIPEIQQQTGSLTALDFHLKHEILQLHGFYPKTSLHQQPGKFENEHATRDCQSRYSSYVTEFVPITHHKAPNLTVTTLCNTAENQSSMKKVTEASI